MTSLVLGIALLILAAAALIFLFVDVWRSWPIFQLAWRKMKSFERAALWAGVCMTTSLPLLKGHDAAKDLLPSIITEVLTATASALFAVGIVAFLQHAHEAHTPQP